MNREAMTSLNLEKIKNQLQEGLLGELGANFTCEVSCWVQDQTLLVFIHCHQPSVPTSPAILEKVTEKFEKESNIFPYSLRFYWIIDGGVYPLDGAKSFSQRFPLTLIPSSPSHLSRIYQGLSLYKLKKKVKKSKYQRLYLKFFGIGLGITLGFALLYFITRPCGIGACPELSQTQREAETLLERIKASPSEAVLAEEREQLLEIINILRSIPFWSPYYSQARELSSRYQDQATQLQSMITAIAKAKLTQQTLQSPSQTVAQWQETKSQMEEAIQILPTTAEFNTLFLPVNDKKRQYQAYLSHIEQRLQRETQATQRFQQGLEAARLAFARQNVAKTLEDWQLVESTWQTALQRFQSINYDTTPYPQARQYLQEYINELVKAQAKKREEEKADKILKDAVNQAPKAQYWQDQQQWSLAVQQWSNALISLQQIPQNSYYYQQAQPLISTYETSLNLAKNQLATAINRQELDQYFKQLCYRPEKICSYRIHDHLIKVNLAQEYHQKIWDTALQAKLQKNKQTQMNLLNHLSRLEKSLQSISLHTQKTVELYHPDGRLMMTFEPQSH